MKKLVLLLTILVMLPNWSWADDANKNHKGGEQGPPGPPGQTGPPGQSIIGPTGPSGQDGASDRLNAYLGAGIRLYDAKRWQAVTYLNQDVHHGGTVVGAQAIWKLGSSYEDRRIDELERELKDLRSSMQGEETVKAVIRGSK